MESSYYLKAYPEDNASGRVILYSTRRGSIALVERETWERLNRGELFQEEENLLRDLGMVVDSRDEERRRFFDQVDLVNHSPELHVTIVPNLACNFDCVYCFESDKKGPHFMSKDTKEAMLDLIRQMLRDGKKSSLRLNWFGGEPLLSLDFIKEVTQELRSIEGVKTSCALVTNGSLLTKKVVQELVPLGLNLVKITLDGPEKVHNRTRPFKGGGGSFAVVMHNLKDICDLVNIHIGGNYTRETWRSFLELLDYLNDEGITPDRAVVIKFDPVMGVSDSAVAPPRPGGGCVTIDDPWVRDASMRLRSEIMKRGYATQRLNPTLCILENKNAFTINYDGLIYKCPAFIGVEGFEVGDVKTGMKDYVRTYEVGSWKNETCMACEYLPQCFGGCRYMKFLKGDNSTDCRKAYLDATLEGMVKQEILYRSRAER